MPGQKIVAVLLKNATKKFGKHILASIKEKQLQQQH